MVAIQEEGERWGVEIRAWFGKRMSREGKKRTIIKFSFFILTKIPLAR